MMNSTQPIAHRTVILASGETVQTNSLRAYTLPFGKFKGLTLGEISQLSKGEWRLWVDGSSTEQVYTAISDDDGIRYLDWLLGVGAKKHATKNNQGDCWLYNDTYDMIAKYMRHPSLERQLTLALAPKVGGEPMILDSGRGTPLIEDLRPSGFQVSDTYDHSQWRNHGPALWINSKITPTDLDPSPWELRGYALDSDEPGGDETDGWAPSLTEEPSFDFTPPVEKPLNNFNVWTEGLSFLMKLEALGDSNTKHVEDMPDPEFPDQCTLFGAATKLQEIITQIKTRFAHEGSWRHTVPVKLREALTAAVSQAKQRLEHIASGGEEIDIRAEMLAEAMLELGMLDQDQERVIPSYHQDEAAAECNEPLELAVA